MVAQRHKIRCHVVRICRTQPCGTNNLNLHYGIESKFGLERKLLIMWFKWGKLTIVVLIKIESGFFINLFINNIHKRKRFNYKDVSMRLGFEILRSLIC